MMLELFRIEDAYDCLIPPWENSVTGTTTLVQVGGLLSAAREGDHAKAWDMYHRLKATAHRLPSSKEGGHALAACGLAACLLGNPRQAQEALSQALDHFRGARHQRSMILWMLGDVFGRIDGNKNVVIHCWEESIGLVEKIERRPSLQPGQAKTYTDLRERMQETLRCFLEDDCDTAGLIAKTGPVTTPVVPKVPEAPVARHRVAKGRASPGDSIGLFGVYDRVPAGGFQAIGPGGDDVPPVWLDTVTIEDVPHRIRLLSEPDEQRAGSAKLRVLPGSAGDLRILQVYGKSMNRAGIDDGDYVLLRLQPSANFNDIVVVEIYSPDGEPEITIKRFVNFRNRRWLEPDTDADIDWDPSVLVNGFQIIGVAIAVFKPVS